MCDSSKSSVYICLYFLEVRFCIWDAVAEVPSILVAYNHPLEAILDV